MSNMLMLFVIALVIIVWALSFISILVAIALNHKIRNETMKVCRDCMHPDKLITICTDCEGCEYCNQAEQNGNTNS